MPDKGLKGTALWPHEDLTGLGQCKVRTNNYRLPSCKQLLQEIAFRTNKESANSKGDGQASELDSLVAQWGPIIKHMHVGQVGARGTDTNGLLDNNVVSSPEIGHDNFLKRGKMPLEILVRVGCSRYYNSGEPVNKQEEDALNFLAWFFSGNVSLNECFQQMRHHLLEASITDYSNLGIAREEILLGKDYRSALLGMSRSNFKKWVTGIPDIMYQNIASSLGQFVDVLHELRIMKYNYLIEEAVDDADKQPGCNRLPHQERRCAHEDKPVIVDLRKPDCSLSVQPKGIRKPPIRQMDVACKHCSTIDTPEWRRGPDGSRTLCNACGLFFSKLVKKYGYDRAVLILKYRKIRGSFSDRTVPTSQKLLAIVQWSSKNA